MNEILTPHLMSIFGRLILAVVLGAFIGFEREFSRKYAGLRTYTLVSLGAALFAVLSEELPFLAMQNFGSVYSFDPSRIISQIVVGIGFLGAGMVIFHNEKVFGLTTAAGIWVTAAVGAAVGIGAYAIAAFATILTLFILVILRWCESLIKRNDNDLIK